MSKPYNTFILDCKKIAFILLSISFLCCSSNKIYYILSFDTNGGSSISEMPIKEGSRINFSETPTWDRHIFLGWYTDQDLKNVFDPNISMTTDLKLYASWKKDPNALYVVSFETDNKLKLDPQLVKSGNKVIGPETLIEKDESVLVDWYTEAGLIHIFDFETVITEDITLYAKWIENFNIPDPNFRIAIKDLIPNAFNEDGLLILNHTDVINLKTINVIGRGINSLEGIQFFKSLTDLRCNTNKLTHLDLSRNTVLTILNCSSNKLTNLDLRGIRKSTKSNLSFDTDDLTSLKVHDLIKDHELLKIVKTNRDTNINIEVYTADIGSNNYTKTCSDYNPNSNTCTTP